MSKALIEAKFYDLALLFRKRGNINLKRCPRCGGTIVWYYLCCFPPPHLAENQMKCLSCGRFFVLTKAPGSDNGKYVWKQYPDRDEEYAVVEEHIENVS